MCFLCLITTFSFSFIKIQDKIPKIVGKATTFYKSGFGLEFLFLEFLCTH